MYSRILVAVDDSKPSELAMREAIKLAQDQGAKLHVLYVVDEYIPIDEGVAVNFEKMDKSAIQRGTEVLGKLLQLVEDATISHVSHLIEIREPHESVSQKIIEAADKWGVDLIVLGTHGRKGLPRLLLGSVSEEVIRNTTIPVHLVRG